jgi:hypothetical protein
MSHLAGGDRTKAEAGGGQTTELHEAAARDPLPTYYVVEGFGGYGHISPSANARFARTPLFILR